MICNGVMDSGYCYGTERRLSPAVTDDRLAAYR